mmetsp:Transcript_155419/g.290052  ORF Transcript_155419/g.290052 Transcript_155419/m.290052 type:complete len:197 (-) Transcript_155419:31-621(-)
MAREPKPKKMRFDEMPIWARKMMQEHEQAVEEEKQKLEAAEDEARVKDSVGRAKVRNRMDILAMLSRSGDEGITVNEALLKAYEQARHDIEALVDSGLVRHIQRIEDSPKEAVENDFPLGIRIFPLFEPDVEAIGVDNDIRELYHSMNRLEAGSVSARVLPQAKEESAKKTRTTRSNHKRAIQNRHMFEDSAPQQE